MPHEAASLPESEHEGALQEPNSGLSGPGGAVTALLWAPCRNALAVPPAAGHSKLATQHLRMAICVTCSGVSVWVSADVGN